MVTVLDDEYMLQMDDAPPFNWLSKSHERVMSCNMSKEGRKIVHAIGNGLTFAYIAKDLLVSYDMEIDEYFSNCKNGMHVIISYSGDNEDSIDFLKGCSEKCTVISAGGRIKKIARENNCEFISLPKGMPSRFVFPEIIGCLTGTHEEQGYLKLENKISKLYPSSLTEENEAKTVGISLFNKKPVIVYDKNTYGIARKFQEDLLQNASVIAPLLSLQQAMMIDRIDSETITVEISRTKNKKIDHSLFIRVEDGIDGSIYAAVLSAYVSIYLSYLYARDIYLFDRIRE